MVSVYEIQPSSSAAKLGHIIDVTEVDVPVNDERIRLLQIERVDVYPQQAKWVLHVHSIPADLIEPVNTLCQAVAKKIPAVQEIAVHAATSEQLAASPSDQADVPDEASSVVDGNLDPKEENEFEDDY